MKLYSIEPRRIKYVKEYGLLSFLRNLLNKHKKQLLGTGLDFLKATSKKVVNKAAVAELRIQEILKKKVFHQKREKKY